MTPFRQLTLALVAVLAIVLLAAACGDDGDASTPTPTPTASPTQPGGGDTPAPSPPTEEPTSEPRLGRLVYVYDVRETPTPTRLWLTRAVVVYDLDGRREVARVEFGGVNDFPVSAVVAGNFIVVATEPRVTRYALDGSGETVLFEVPGGSVQDLSSLFVAGIAVSPDERVLALTVYTLGECGQPCDGLEDGAVLFFDIESGRELARVLKRDAFPEYVGWPAYPQWRADGAGVVVTASTHSENPGSVVTVRLDGTATIHASRGGMISPDGTRVALGSGDWVACFDSSKLRVATLDGDTTVQEVDGDGKGLVALGWSPDGSTVVYMAIEWADPSKACDQEPISRETMLLDVATGEVRSAGDLVALQHAWYGDQAVTMACEAGAMLDGLPWNRRFSCYDPVQYTRANGTVSVRGVDVATLPELTVLAVLEGVE
ncbi:MAG: hypothetical protein Kow0010_00060 [Dehalococcoidia bacterium]